MARKFLAACTLVVAATFVSGCGGSQSSPPSAAGGTLQQSTTNTGSAAAASYRHGLVPMLGTTAGDRAQAEANAEAISAKDLHFRGGTNGIGVLTGLPRVYLIFWGTQWGTQGTEGNGYATFSGDPDGVAPYLQAFFAGLGTGTEEWSGIVTQYCNGVIVGATSCPSTAPEAGFPTGGALAAVWEDTSAASPAQATAHQLAVEAERAATHFGFTTQAESIHHVYIIVSPTGTNPDNYLGQGFCAWHDYTGDSTLDGGGSASGPHMNFTNLPYVPDAGPGCGAGFVNPGNVLDGVSIVGGHEYAETLTDEFPAGGWTANDGEEIGDLCAWKTSGGGKTQNLALTTGTFAVQGLWSNRANTGFGGCVIKQAQL